MKHTHADSAFSPKKMYTGIAIGMQDRTSMKVKYVFMQQHSQKIDREEANDQ